MSVTDCQSVFCASIVSSATSAGTIVCRNVQMEIRALLKISGTKKVQIRVPKWSGIGPELGTGSRFVFDQKGGSILGRNSLKSHISSGELPESILSTFF